MYAHFKEDQPVMSQPSFIDKFSQQFSLEPNRTALLIIDMQNATGNREMGLGKLLAEQGNIASAQYRFDRIENLLIPNIQRLIAGFKDAGAHIIWITYGANAADASDAPQHIAPIIKATNNIAGQPEHEIVDALKPGAGDLVLNKTTQGAFRSTALDSSARARCRYRGIYRRLHQQLRRDDVDGSVRSAIPGSCNQRRHRHRQRGDAGGHADHAAHDCGRACSRPTKSSIGPELAAGGSRT